MRWRSAGCALSVVSVSLAAGCLDRPIGVGQPRTTNVLVNVLRRDTVTKIDLLFMIDNSRSMADKQELFAEALPDLVSGLVDPPCLTADGEALEGIPPTEPCPSGAAREFEPVQDIHIGVVTSSINGYTSRGECLLNDTSLDNESADNAHLLASLPRGAKVAASATDGFLAWRPDADNSPLIGEFGGLVQAAGENGCGWEASLEAWYRFLVDPEPYAELERVGCSASDSNALCIAPKKDPATGAIVVDEEILAQRRAFLRPDSLVAIVMLTDENDCSFKASGLTRNFAETSNGEFYTRALRGTTACSDPAFGPNSPCCHSCALVPRDECPSAVDDKGRVVGAGCEEGRRFTDDTEDQPNLRCFNQKQRFGIDLLYPVERYSNALKEDMLCTLSDDLDPKSELCAGGVGLKPNPLFFPNSEGAAAYTRPKSQVFLAGILGVPWQDIAVTPSNDETLVYRHNNTDASADATKRIDWGWLLGERLPGGVPPGDPLMIETVDPRTGTNPATGEALAPPDSGPDANSINGHEWHAGNVGLGDLQYACVFPLAKPELCEEDDDTSTCDCADLGDASYNNPLCQQTNGEYGLEQRRAKAYPGIRELQVLQDFGKNSIVASICPKSIDPSQPDYGYRPAMAAIVERLKEGLEEQCFQRELEVGPSGVQCVIVEARSVSAGDPAGCDSRTRRPVSEAVDESVREKLVSTGLCADAASCEALQLCAIDQLTTESDAEALQSCLSDQIPVGDGWCYVDPALGQGNAELVKKCPETSRRKVRFVGEGTPRPGTFTVFSCSGATFED